MRNQYGGRHSAAENQPRRGARNRRHGARYSGAFSECAAAAVGVMTGQPDALLTAALAAREHAFAPYSDFKVGAAVEDNQGRIHTGCNVENATYGLTVCAERVAIFKAISEGAHIRMFRRVAVAADTDALAPPCGAC